MSEFRGKHEWCRPKRILCSVISTCRHCGLLRVVDDYRPTTYVLRDPPEHATEAQRVLEEAPACVPGWRPPSRARREKRDRIGCELGPRAREQALRSFKNRNGS